VIAKSSHLSLGIIVLVKEVYMGCATPPIFG